MLRTFYAFLLILTHQFYLIAQEQRSVYDLRCERLEKPVSIDVPNPRFSWKILDERYGASQSAYRITVKNTEEELIWDSGVTSSNSRMARYDGKPLESFKDYSFEVEAWDEKGLNYIKSTSSFQTSILAGETWEAQWINDGQSIESRPAYYFRKTFEAIKEVDQARLHIAVAGYAHIEFNGVELAGKFLNPAFTNYDRRVLFDTYQLDASYGQNTLGILMGNGWYNHQVSTTWAYDKAPWRGRPGFMAIIEIDYKDGSSEFIPSDQTWLIHESPIRFNSIYFGENYDQSFELSNWSKNEIDLSTWENASIMTAPKGKIVAQRMEAVIKSDTLRPISMKEINSNYVQYKFIKNFAGVSSLEMDISRPTQIELIHGEVLNEAGQINSSQFKSDYSSNNSKEQFHKDFINLNPGKAHFSSKFNYKGFQYVEVKSDRPLGLKLNDVYAFQTHQNFNQIGKIEIGLNRLNQLWEACNNSYLSNAIGIPTDCPQREKNGWTGDAHIISQSGLFNYNATLFYEKWLRDHQDAQSRSGVLPSVIPTAIYGYDSYAFDWTSSVILIPWDVYVMTGDKTILKENYNMMKRFISFYVRNSKDLLLEGGYGDWSPAKTISKPTFTTSAYLYHCVETLSKIAESLLEIKDANSYAQLAEAIKVRINEEYFIASENSYNEGTQTELALAIDFNIVPETRLKQVGQTLIDRIAENNGLLDVGLLGSKGLMNALIKIEANDMAMSLLKETRKPSWGYWMSQGLTSLPENWSYYNNYPYSSNHAFLGAINAWMYRNLAGINPDEYMPGFEHIKLKPLYDHGLGKINASFDSPYGLIKVQLTPIDESVFNYKVVIPAGTSADFKPPKGFEIIDYISTGMNKVFPQQADEGSVELISGSHEFILSSNQEEPFQFEPITIEAPSVYGKYLIENGILKYKQGQIKVDQLRYTIFDNLGRTKDSFVYKNPKNDKILILNLMPYRTRTLQIKFDILFEDGVIQTKTKRLRLQD